MPDLDFSDYVLLSLLAILLLVILYSALRWIIRAAGGSKKADPEQFMSSARRSGAFRRPDGE